MAIQEQDYVGFGIDPTTGNRHAIKHLPEQAVWEDGIYQIEQGDKVMGGTDGISNLPAAQLANRTAYLYQMNKELLATAKRLSRTCNMLVRLVPVDSIIDTKVASQAPDDGSAWIYPEGGIVNCAESPKILLEDSDTGKTMENPVALIEVSDGRVIRVGSEWVPLDEVDMVYVGDSHVIEMENGTTLTNSDAEILTDTGQTIDIHTEGPSSTTGEAANETVYRSDIDSIFDA